jgi:carbonic anhydrase
MNFKPFTDLERSVKNSVGFLKDSRLIPASVEISGWIYEVETGKTKRVV